MDDQNPRHPVPPSFRKVPSLKLTVCPWKSPIFPGKYLSNMGGMFQPVMWCFTVWILGWSINTVKYTIHRQCVLDILLGFPWVCSRAKPSPWKKPTQRCLVWFRSSARWGQNLANFEGRERKVEKKHDPLRLHGMSWGVKLPPVSRPFSGCH